MLQLLLCSLLSLVATGEDFLWGTAGASYQIEGGVNEGGRLPSIWDTFCHTPNKCAHNMTGDIADDDYHRWKEDIDLAAGLGTDSYRLSIAWSRIIPDGISINSEGIDFYNNVLDYTVHKGLKPFVTMYHWDLPQAVYDMTDHGWLNESIVPLFRQYAQVLFEVYGDRVKHWITFNEPWTFCQQGYGDGVHAPGRCTDRSICDEGDSATEAYLCAHYVLISHAQVCQLYHESYAPEQKGIIGMTLNGDWGYAMSDDDEDEEAAERNVIFQIGWFADPIYFGEYPEVMRYLVGDRLPNFTQYESDMLKGSSDFYGMNQYTGKWIANHVYDTTTPNWHTDQQTDVQAINYNGTAIGIPAASDWLWVTPTAIRYVMNWISDRYGNPPIYITENGVDCPNETIIPLPEVLNDTCRIDYYQSYVGDNVLPAMKEDGVNLKGYTAWALLDNFEWADGYTKRFGLHYVDYSVQNLTRYPKASSRWYAEFIKNNP